MRLQNNNIPRFVKHNSQIPKDSPYIPEQKVSNIYNVPNNTQLISNAISKLTNTLNNQLTEYTQKKEQIQSINLFNDYLIEYDNLTKRYKADYSLNPEDDNITKEYVRRLKDLKKGYEDQVPTFYKNDFSYKVDNVIKQTDLDFFRKQTSLQFQAKKFTDRMDETLNNIREQTYKGDMFAFETGIMTIPLLKQQAIDIFGNYNGEKLINDYKSKMLQSYISGQLLTDNPIKAIEMLDKAQQLEDFNNSLTPTQIEQCKETARKRQEEIDSWNRNKEISEHIIANNIMLQKIRKGEIKGYDDIITNLISNNCDEYESKLILHYSGYGTTLPLELIEHINQLKQEEKDIKDKEKQEGINQNNKLKLINGNQKINWTQGR